MVAPSIPAKRTEGPVAKAIEQQTSRVPSDVFLWAAVGAIGTSLLFQTMNKRERSLFFGQWAPTLLILGLYNKIVKVAGSDRFDDGMGQGFQGDSGRFKQSNAGMNNPNPSFQNQ